MNSFLRTSVLIFAAQVISSWGFAADSSQHIGIGTKLNFQPSEDGGIVFARCEDDANSSCSIMRKIEDNGDVFKSEKKCTLRIHNQDVAKLGVPKEGRILTVSSVIRNEESKVVAFNLNGAKVLISLSCSSEITQRGNLNSYPNFPLTQKVLTGFKEFKLEDIKHDVVTVPKPSVPMPQIAPSAPRTGATI